MLTTKPTSVCKVSEATPAYQGQNSQWLTGPI